MSATNADLSGKMKFTFANYGVEEGDTCFREWCQGKLAYVRNRSCSCHINPPCSACVDAKLACTKCGFEPEEEV